MKKLISLVLVSSILASSSLAFATETSSEPTQSKLMSVSEDAMDMVRDIPVYITYLNSFPEEDVQEVKEQSNEAITNYVESVSAIDALVTNEYEVVSVSDTERADMYSNPIYAGTFNQVYEAVRNGTDVSYINFFVQNGSSAQNGAATYAEVNSTSWWEQNYPSYGTWNGYKFLYAESSYGVNTNEVEPGNLSIEMAWTDLMQERIGAVADMLIDNAFLKSMRTGYSVLSTILGAIKPAVNVTVREAKDGYIKALSEGTIYQQTVFIRDDLDKVNGQAYVPWASMMRFSTFIRVRILYPISKNPGGTYNYKPGSGETPTLTMYTPGYKIYSGSWSPPYERIVQLYKSNTGYATYDEMIDTHSIMVSMLS